jgi:ribonucleoside-diphosphate reductase beta chain
MYVADHLLSKLNEPPIYKVMNPFPWMELISLPTKHNFFERKVSNYQKGLVMEGSSREEDFSTSSDF